jgi:amidase
VAEAAPDLGGAREAFLTLRAHSYAQNLGELLAEHREEMKPTLVWNIEQGLVLTDDDVERAVARRDEVRGEAASFFATYDVLVVPVSQVPPFDVDLEYPTHVAGTPMHTYLDWMESCWSVTVLGAPAISVPCGFTDDGLPIGMQIVAKPGADAAVLRLARAFERATEVGAIRPTAPAPAPRRPAT